MYQINKSIHYIYIYDFVHLHELRDGNIFKCKWKRRRKVETEQMARSVKVLMFRKGSFWLTDWRIKFWTVFRENSFIDACLGVG